MSIGKLVALLNLNFTQIVQLMKITFAHRSSQLRSNEYLMTVASVGTSKGRLIA